MRVNRYQPAPFTERVLHASDDGEYVKHEDYAALEARCAALAAENAGLKSKGRELLIEAGNVYEKFNASVNPEEGDFMDGQTLQEFQFLLDVETPATDAFMAEVQAQGVEQLAIHMELNGYSNEAAGAREYADQIRKGVQS